MDTSDPGDDAEFEYDDAAFDPGQFDESNLRASNPATRPKVTIQVQNKPHDEEVALSESESGMSPDDLPVHRGFTPSGASQVSASHDSLESSQSPRSPQSRLGQSSKQYPQGSPSEATSRSPREDSPPAAEASPSAGQGVIYNPDDYKNLNVSEDVKDLFKYIGRYRPQTIELEAQLKPFIPDYIPALGGIDEFIKVPRPDGKPDHLGLKVLDEPAVQQSDPAVLNLQLRQLSRDAPSARLEVVGKVEHGDSQKPKRIGQWMQSIADVHKNRAPGSVAYSQPMPDIEVLMQEWPPELEAALHSMRMPSSQLDLDLNSYSRLVCGLLDIPVYGDRVIESLHLLFTLFLEFKSNPFFKQIDDEMDIPRGSAAASAGSHRTPWKAEQPLSGLRAASAASSQQSPGAY